MKIQKKLLFDLYRVAIIDGELTQDEMIVLNNYCFQNDISFDELTKVTKTINDSDFQLPNNEVEQNKYLFEIARIIVSDGLIRSEEIYLFNQIAKKLKVKNDISVIRNQIFALVIDEFIAKKEKALNNLKKSLKKEYKNMVEDHLTNTNEATISITDHVQLINELKRGYQNGQFTAPYAVRKKCFVVGHAGISEDDIKSIIVRSFKDNEITIRKKDIKTCVGSFDEVKSKYKRYNQSVQNGEYDYLIYGPHPHLLKGREGSNSWEFSLQNTITKMKGDYKNPITASNLEQYIQSLC
jgi:bifunctional DNA-binding transcriptional regulator/antitoxin component of YhaV-PrlF toxin-antitoxin module